MKMQEYIKLRKCPFCGSEALYYSDFVPVTKNSFYSRRYLESCKAYESETEALKEMARIITARGKDDMIAFVSHIDITELFRLQLGDQAAKRLINKYVVIPAPKKHFVGCSNLRCFAGNRRSFSSEQEAMDAWNGTETENKKEEPCSI